MYLPTSYMRSKVVVLTGPASYQDEGHSTSVACAPKPVGGEDVALRSHLFDVGEVGRHGEMESPSQQQAGEAADGVVDTATLPLSARAANASSLGCNQREPNLLGVGSQVGYALQTRQEAV